MSTGTEATAPPSSFIELSNQKEELISGGVEVGGQASNLVTEPIQVLRGSVLFRKVAGGVGIERESGCRGDHAGESPHVIWYQ